MRCPADRPIHKPEPRRQRGLQPATLTRRCGRSRDLCREAAATRGRLAARPRPESRAWTGPKHRPQVLPRGRAIDHIVIHYTTFAQHRGLDLPLQDRHAEVLLGPLDRRPGRQAVQTVADKDCAGHAGTSDMNLRRSAWRCRAGRRPVTRRRRGPIALDRRHARLRHPVAHVIPHVCVKTTSRCGDLFKDFGGGAGLPSPRQKAALHKRLAANGIARGRAAGRVDAVEPAAASATAAASRGGIGIAPLAEGTLSPAAWLLPASPRLRGPPRRAGADRRLPSACGRRWRTLRGGRHQRARSPGGLRRAGRADPRGRHAEAEGAWPSRSPETPTRRRRTRMRQSSCSARPHVQPRPGRAASILQNAVGVATDRDVAPITLAAAQAGEAAPEQRPTGCAGAARPTSGCGATRRAGPGWVWSTAGATTPRRSSS